MATGIRTFTYTQTAPAQTWTINHNLGIKPVSEVSVLHNGTMNKILPAKVTHVTDNTMLIEFSTPRQGVARLIGM